MVADGVLDGTVVRKQLRVRDIIGTSSFFFY